MKVQRTRKMDIELNKGFAALVKSVQDADTMWRELDASAEIVQYWDDPPYILLTFEEEETPAEEAARKRREAALKQKKHLRLKKLKDEVKKLEDAIDFSNCEVGSGGSSSKRGGIP